MSKKSCFLPRHAGRVSKTTFSLTRQLNMHTKSPRLIRMGAVKTRRQNGTETRL